MCSVICPKPTQGGVGIKANDETKQAAKFAEKMHAELYVNTLRCGVPLKNEIRCAAIFSICKAEDEGLPAQVEDDNEAYGKKGKQIFYF